MVAASPNVSSNNPTIGEPCPEFELHDHKGNLWKSKDCRGKVVVLLFYPKDETPVCTKQLCSLRDTWQDYQETGAEVVAISVGSVHSHQAFAQRHQLPIRLLADEHGAVTRCFGLKSWISSASQRAVIVIDADGIIRYRKTWWPISRPKDQEILVAIQLAKRIG